jgi:hypothetical protein
MGGAIATLKQMIPIDPHYYAEEWWEERHFFFVVYQAIKIGIHMNTELNAVLLLLKELATDLHRQRWQATRVFRSTVGTRFLGSRRLRVKNI